MCFSPFWPKHRKQSSGEQLCKCLPYHLPSAHHLPLPFLPFTSPETFLSQLSTSRNVHAKTRACCTSQADKCGPPFLGQAFKKPPKNALHNPQDMHITHQNNHGYLISACFFPISYQYIRAGAPQQSRVYKAKASGLGFFV